MEMIRGTGVPPVKSHGQDAHATSLFDLGIIGGGPAGTAAALEARRHGLHVALWERDRFPRDKVCGEFLSPESIPILQEEIPLAIARAAVIRRSEFIATNGHVLSFEFPSPGRGLSRRVLDAALWKAAGAAGAVTRECDAVRRVGGLEAAANQSAEWEIESETGSIARARVLVLACGRWWAVDGIPSPAREKRDEAAGPWMGAKAHFSGVAPRDAVEMYYFRGGYCGLAPVEDGMYNACFLVHRSVVRHGHARTIDDFARWLGDVARHPVLQALLRGATQVTSTVSTAPIRPARRRAAHERTLIAGDAAGFLDPFTGDGISIALHSGRLAAAELAKAWSNANVDFAPAAASYARQMNRAVRRSYLVAGLLRGLVCAPALVQSSAAAALRWFGTRLLAETRWRESV